MNNQQTTTPAQPAIVPRRLTGCCTSGAERGSGVRYHALPPGACDWSAALCGAKPGRRSAGWSQWAGTVVTCPRCLKKISKFTHTTRHT